MATRTLGKRKITEQLQDAAEHVEAATGERRKPRKKGLVAGTPIDAIEKSRRPVFDIGQRRARGTVDIPIYDPEDLSRLVDTGIRIRIASVWSKVAQDAAAAAAEGKDIKIEESNGVRRVVASEDLIDENVFEQTIGATVYWYHADLSQPRKDDGTWPAEDGFDGVLLLDGEKMECTPLTVRELYTNPETRWIQRQVEPWYLNVGNFFGGPKSQSPSPRASASA